MIRDLNTIELPPSPRPVRHRRYPSSGTVLGMVAILVLAAGGLILGLAVGGSLPTGFVSTPHPVLSLPPDPPSDAPVTEPVAGPPVPPPVMSQSTVNMSAPGRPSRHHPKGLRLLRR